MDNATLKLGTLGTPVAGVNNGGIDSLPWLGRELVRDARFAKGGVQFWYRALFKRLPLIPPVDQSQPDYAAKLAAFTAQDAVFSELAARFSQDQGHGVYNVKDLLVDLVMSDLFRADIASGTEPVDLPDVGLARLLTPSELYAKTESVSGARWSEFGGTPWSQQLGRLYGGFDGGSQVTDVNTDIGAVMNNIPQYLALKNVCNTVRDDFRRSPASRLLFADVEPTALPDGSGDAAIRTAIRFLHQQLLGEFLTPGGTEENRTFNLFKELWMSREPVSANVSCSLNSASADPDYTRRAWAGVLVYLMGDPYYLYQ